MSRFVVAVVGVALLGVAAAAGAAAPKHKPACPPRGEHVRLIDKTALVYGSIEEPVGCLRPTGRHYRLYDSDEYVGGGGIRLTGRFAAWEYDEINPCSKYQQCPPGTDVNTATIKTIDLRSGKRRSSHDQFNITVMKLASNGVAVWISTGEGSVVSIRMLGATGETTLDSGAIDVHALAVHGTTASWTKDGTEQTANLAAR